MRVIGDLHGDTEKLRALCEEVDDQTKIVQVGDYSIQEWDYADYYSGSLDLHTIGRVVDIIPGNHDHWPTLLQGNILSPINTHFDCEDNFFWVGGAESIDRHLRNEGFDWWREEEMDYLQGRACLAEYESLSRKGTLPDIFISHDAPYKAVRELHNQHSSETHDGPVPPSKTQAILQQCLDIKPPKVWIFGHHHISARWLDWNTETLYISLGIGEHIDIDLATNRIS